MAKETHMVTLPISDYLELVELEKYKGLVEVNPGEGEREDIKKLREAVASVARTYSMNIEVFIRLKR